MASVFHFVSKYQNSYFSFILEKNPLSFKKRDGKIKFSLKSTILKVSLVLLVTKVSHSLN